VRLAFAVAAHLEPDILIVDEVLAVGDSQFQSKCLGKIREVSRQDGRTVLFVSHNMAAVKNLCTRAVWLQRGSVRSVGPAEKLVVEYLNEIPVKSTVQRSAFGLTLRSAQILRVKSGDSVTQLIFGEDYQLNVRIAAAEPFTQAGVVMQVCDAFGETISSICTPEEGIAPFAIGSEVTVSVSLQPLRLFPGKYRIDVFVFRPNDATRYLDAEGALSFEVHPGVIAGGVWAYQNHHGCVRIADEVSVKL